MRLSTVFWSLVCGLWLTGCTQLLPIGKEAQPTYTLRYQGPEAPVKTNGPIIFLDDPILVEGLGGRVVTVDLPDGERRNLKGIRWSEPLGRLLRHYFERSLAAGSNANMVGEGGLDIDATCRIGLKVWSFELRPGATKNSDQVRAGIEATLVSLERGELLSRRLFTHDASVGGNRPRDVVAAFQVALDQTGGQLGGWLDGLIGGCIPS